MATLRSLTERCSRGIGFRVLGNILLACITFAVGILVARILSPQEYGLFGVAFSLMVVAERLGGFGMLQALIQRQPLTAAHETAGFLMCGSGTLLVSGLLLLLAPMIEDFMRMPGLTPVLRWQAGVLVVDGLALTPAAWLHRQLAFGRLGAIQVGGKLIGGGVTVGLALQGFGAMALVFGNIAGAVMHLLGLWACAPRRIRLVWQSQAFRDLLGYGSGDVLISLASSLALRMDVLIAGRQLGSGAVGLYHRATHLAALPINFLMQPINRVLFPALASVQGQREKSRRGYLAAARMASLVAVPLMVGLWGTAGVLVPLVYGPQWSGTVPILQLLAIAGIFRILLVINGVVIQAHGRVMAQAVRQIVWLVLIAAFGYAGSLYGEALGTAAGVSAATGLFWVILTVLALRVTQVRWWELLGAMRAGLLASGAMAVALWGVYHVVAGAVPRSGLLLALVGVGGATYLAAARLWLTAEDRRFLDSVCQGLPALVSGAVRFMLRIPAKKG